MDKQTWTENLKSYVLQQRQSHPIPDRATLSDEEEMQCRILGGEFMSWCRQPMNAILQQRHVLRVMEFDAEPVIVLTTSLPGLVAAAEIFGDENDDLVYLLDEEFQSWDGYNSDANSQWHIHHWSHFGLPNAEQLQQASQAFPQISAANFRVHATGDLWGPQCGFEALHLWKWTGDEMELLAEAFSVVNF